MKSKTVRFTLRVNKDLNDQLENIAQRQMTSKNSVILKACKKLLDDYYQENKPQKNRGNK